MLEGRGYRILEAPSGEEALRIAAGHAEPIHLLLTDVRMPGMSGHGLVQQLGRLRPEVKVLYMSAFALITGREEFSRAESGALEPRCADHPQIVHHRAPDGEGTGSARRKAALSF